MYLDTAASAKSIDGAVAERMLSLLGQQLGNPSSAHREGQRARRGLREAREEAAAALGADPDEVVFTSGVTEALFLAVRGLAIGRTVEVSELCHPAFLTACEGLARGAGGLVCASLVNHETGILTDLDALS